MKSVPAIIGTALISLLVGCSTTPVAVAPVGPNPAGLNNHAANGQLEVYSALVGRSEGNNPAWFQHADYTIYDQNGNRVRYVMNTTGNYSKRPTVVSLPPGNYIVKTRAKDYFRVTVPVVIASGRTTRVHLDDSWRPEATASAALVTLPSGNPVGWNAGAK
jgi:hypothetical protein